MNGGVVHVIGAGVSGLAAAVRLTSAGRHVVIHEAAGHAGGRCRSYLDPVLNRRIDNGNHLLLSGNKEVMAYLDAIGGRNELTGQKRAAFPFLDLESGERWAVRPGKSRLPLWLLCRHMRVPGTTAFDYLGGLKMAMAEPEATVADCLDTSRPIFRKFWQPLAVSVLNTAADEGAASLLWPVLKQTFGQGAAACRPLMARQGLSETFVDPAISWLAARGAEVHFNDRLKSIEGDASRATTLNFATDHAVPLTAGDAVILAVPADIAGGLLPGLIYPDQSRAIVNGHFLLDHADQDISFLGLVGGVSHWLFVRGDIASVTVSAADTLAAEPAETIAQTLWAEVALALELGNKPLPVHRIVKEKRATFAQTPAQVARRPATESAWENLMLAGDWTATGLPATIEGAMASGHKAARAIEFLTQRGR